MGEGGARLACIHYAASKVALIGLVRSLAGPLIEGGETLPDDKYSREQLAARVPVGRLGQPEKVAEIVNVLVTNSFVTSQTICVDGGVHTR